ncbi:MAG: dihydroorotase [Christensenellaceae bacterium]|jgi:dihydroorotase|nr:dihydroorotase [Christensenellaceae bacterium]
MIILKNAKITTDDAKLTDVDILIVNNTIREIKRGISNPNALTFDVGGALVIPGAVDVHTHLREPGFKHKETIKSGTRAAAKGGVTSIMSMPNLRPVTDSVDEFNNLNEIIKRDACIKVYPFASLTKGQAGDVPSDILGLSTLVKGFSDDGVCVNNESVLRECMKRVKACDSIIASHAEYIGLGKTREAEIKAVERELRLVRQIGCKYHFCHLSTSDSIEMALNAQNEGLDVTFEVTPHHLVLCEDDIKGNTNFKMNPPLRMMSDHIATREALLNSRDIIIATDHAPHSVSEKNTEYDEAPNGIIGLETFIPLIYTEFVRTGLITINKMIDCITFNPAKRFKLEHGVIKVGGVADIAIIAIDERQEYTLDDIQSLSKNSPFIGRKLYGNNILTLVNGCVKYADSRFDLTKENLNKGVDK